MAAYIDGFAFPLARKSLNRYRPVAAAIGEIWKEHGAIDYREFVGDDMALEGTRSFIDAVAASDGDVVVFGWVAFESREARDEANEKVASDPRVAELTSSSDTGFEAERMAYGGFCRSSAPNSTEIRIDMSAVNLKDKLATFAEHWSPKIVSQFNGHDVMVVKVQGEFNWHSHPDTDDFFLVLNGEVTIKLRDRDVELKAGELYVVPKGVEHCPVAAEEAEILLIEPAGTPNTGDVETAAEKVSI